ncbi:S8 family serine peptidase [Bradyrhizobium sp.]|uniref:S8 family serine peptidase n=1 Tax=Bradyrhizobium sp. TaxID=376 RepID=UPI0025BC91C3|nr:S8 family serine peptidase [Bradyrhizobium sp.]
MRCAVAALTAAVLSFVCLGVPAAHAQSIMRSPNLNIGPRVPSINPNVGPRLAPNIAGRGDFSGRTTSRVGVRNSTSVDRRPVPAAVIRSTLPYLRLPPYLYPACGDADGAGERGCLDRPVSSARNNTGGPPRNAPINLHTVAGELVAEIDGSGSVVQADELARRHGLVRLELQHFPLIDSTIGLFRIVDRRPADTVANELASDASVRSVQPNFRYVLQDQKVVLTEGDPAQYALTKLRLPEAHQLAHGAHVTVAVIDSGIDDRHPELANAIADTFDALGSKEGPHAHGTGIAGAIVSHAKLMGSAPAARILAIRAFGAAPNGAESTSFVLLRGLDYAVAHGAQIVNMSFAGPKDGLIERGIAAVAAKGIVMVAASGNAGPKSPPLYPAANSNVIAVSATDAQDRLFAASNRGSYVAVSAPGVDIFLPAPDAKYQITSGTSFSAAYVSGLAALMLERNPALKPDEVRAILMRTARDLGAPGRDDLFGAGEADAFAAVSAVASAPAIPVTDAPPSEKVSNRQDLPATRALNEPAAAMASEKSGEGVGPAAH